MFYNERLKEFFVEKKLKINEIADVLGYSPVMAGRYLEGSKFNMPFILKVNENFPDVDWNYILKDRAGVEEPTLEYKKTPEILLNEIKVRVAELEEWHKSDTKQK